MDITGNNEVAGARLLLKDKEGNVIESWMSATEAHVFEQKLIAGETYTLAEVTAPSGYEVAADITLHDLCSLLGIRKYIPVPALSFL